jgi:hypothetical protein
MHDGLTKIFQCKYCSFTSHWSKDITRHQREIHPNYPPHILQKDYQDTEINNNMEEEIDEQGISALMIDPIRAFGEVIDNNDDEEEEGEEEEEEEEEMIDEHEIDDDEDDA